MTALDLSGGGTTRKRNAALSATGQQTTVARARVVAVLVVAFAFAALTVAALYGMHRQDRWCASHSDQARTASACAYSPHGGNP